MSMRKNKLSSTSRLAAACLVALLGAGAAQAATSSASISNVQFQVRDLELHDGQAASYSFANPETQLVAEVLWSPVDFDAGNQGAPGWMSTLSLSSGLEGVSSSANVGSAGLFATGSASRSRAEYNSSALTTTPKVSPGPAGLLIAPHTELTISADWEVYAATEGPCTDFMNCQWASAVAGFGWTHGGGQFSDSQQFEVNSNFYSPDRLPHHENGAFSFTLINSSDQWATEYIGFSVRTWGSVPWATPVPEPAAFALMGTGLLALLLFKRASFKGASQ